MKGSRISDSIESRMIEEMDKVCSELDLSVCDITRDYKMYPDKNRFRKVVMFHKMVNAASYLFTLEKQAEILGMNHKTIENRIHTL